LFSFRKPEPRDGKRIHKLVDECKPLDLNSLYAYLLVAHHFRDTSVVADRGDDIVGFISGYLPPTSREVIFVWQVAVSPAARRYGLAKAMLREIVSRDYSPPIKFLETTVTPSNHASARLFRSLANELGAACHENELFGANLFADGTHESETRFRIGPFSNGLEASP
jgi:L-2,4-diaminobutyric acid acetyltransferase